MVISIIWWWQISNDKDWVRKWAQDAIGDEITKTRPHNDHREKKTKMLKKIYIGFLSSWVTLTSLNAKSVQIVDRKFRIYSKYAATIFIVAAVVIFVQEWSHDAVDCVPSVELVTKMRLVTRQQIVTQCKSSYFIPVADTADCTDCSECESRDANGRANYTTTAHRWYGAILLTFANLVYIPYFVWSYCNRTVFEVKFQQIKYECDQQPPSEAKFEKTRGILLKHLTKIASRRPRLGEFYLLLKVGCLAVLGFTIYFSNVLLENKFLTYPMIYSYKRFPKLFGGVGGCAQSMCLTERGANETDIKCYPVFDDIFPSTTFCPYSYNDTLGEDGTVLKTMVKCLMPINATLEIVYLFLWLVLFVLVLMGAVDLMANIPIYFNRSVRRRWLRRNIDEDVLDDDHLKILSKSYSLSFYSFILVGTNLPLIASLIPPRAMEIEMAMLPTDRSTENV